MNINYFGGEYVFIICFCFFSYMFKQANSEFSEEHKIFVEYLEGNNDTESLKRVGEINMFGVRERWIPKYSALISYLEKKIDETNDKEFVKYYYSYKKFVKKFLGTVPFIVLSIAIPLSCIVSLIQK